MVDIFFVSSSWKGWSHIINGFKYGKKLLCLLIWSMKILCFYSTKKFTWHYWLALLEGVGGCGFESPMLTTTWDKFSLYLFSPLLHKQNHVKSHHNVFIHDVSTILNYLIWNLVLIIFTILGSKHLDPYTMSSHLAFNQCRAYGRFHFDFSCLEYVFNTWWIP
jgi:hypothetical protein